MTALPSSLRRPLSATAATLARPGHLPPAVSARAITEIEIYLTGYLLVFICSAFEEHIEGLVNERASKSPDTFLAEFVRSAMSQLFRSTKTSEIAGLLGRFGEEHGKRFQIEMTRNPRAATYFNNLVLNRHGTAHKAGSDLTFSEVVNFYSEVHTVLDAVALVLGLT